MLGELGKGGVGDCVLTADCVGGSRNEWEGKGRECEYCVTFVEKFR